MARKGTARAHTRTKHTAERRFKNVQGPRHRTLSPLERLITVAGGWGARPRTRLALHARMRVLAQQLFRGARSNIRRKACVARRAHAIHDERRGHELAACLQWKRRTLAPATRRAGSSAMKCKHVHALRTASRCLGERWAVGKQFRGSWLRMDSGQAPSRGA
eukprot:5293919-Pleurochrysis_carterae.AAC.2